MILYQNKKNALNRKKTIYDVNQKFDVCGYSNHCFVSLGWMIDEIIMALFMNTSHIKSNLTKI